MMSIYLLLLLMSFLVHFLAMVPFINFLYKIKFQRAHQHTTDAFDVRTPIFDKFHNSKAGTPVGGGILIAIITTILYVLFLFILPYFGVTITSNYPKISSELILIIFTFISFAILGFTDDIAKFYLSKGLKKTFFGIRLRHKLIIELVLALMISSWLFYDLKIDLINVPFFRPLPVSWIFIPFSTFVIVAFANALNITDGLDGLATGSLIISLVAFWSISIAIVDTPTQLFIALLLGGLLAFLYFNVHPARIFLGDTGSLSLGATLAVIGLLLGKSFALVIIGGVFVVEAISSLSQLLAKKLLGKKIMTVAPLHLLLQHYGWEESKIVMRAWIVAILLSLIGLMFAFLQ